MTVLDWGSPTYQSRNPVSRKVIFNFACAAVTGTHVFEGRAQTDVC